MINHQPADINPHTGIRTCTACGLDVAAPVHHDCWPHPHLQELEDMRALLASSAAALDIDASLVHPDTAATIAAVRQAEASAARASQLVTSTAQSLGSGCKR